MADGTVEVGGGAEIPTEDEIRQLEAGLQDDTAAGAAGADTLTGAEATDDDEGEGDRSTRVDSELDEAPDDAARAAIRERRRQERLRKKQLRNDKLEGLERLVQTQAVQLQRQAEVLLRLQNTDASSRLAQLDGAINEAAEVYERYKGILADATTKADGVTAAEATERMHQARDRHTQLTNVKNQIVQSATNTPQPVDPRVASEARRFAARHTWYKGVQSQDPDSQVLTLIDNSVARDKFDPTTPEYWAELEARAKRYLPHRFNTAEPAGGSENGYTGAAGEPRPATGKPRSPVGGSATGARTSTNGGGFVLSAERVAAMKEAGIWDDVDRRNKMIQRYKDQDRAQRSSN